MTESREGIGYTAITRSRLASKSKLKHASSITHVKPLTFTTDYT